MMGSKEFKPKASSSNVIGSFKRGHNFSKIVTGDCQSQGLAEWLQSLGWHGDLQPADLQKLNTPKMRSIWRHLQAHVMPTQFANTIRKNVLLSRLEEENIFVGQFGNFKLDSINQLSKVKEMLKTEEVKEKVKEEIKSIDEEIQKEKYNLLEKNNMLEGKRYKLSEIENKTMILELKYAKLREDCERLNVDQHFVSHLMGFKNSLSHSERNYQKSSVCKYVKNYRYPFNDIDDDSEYICEMMASILDFKPDSINDGITHTAKEALRSLNPKVEFIASTGEIASTNKKETLQKKLRDVKISIIRRELQITECLEKIQLESKELEKEKRALELLEAVNEKKIGLEKTSDGSECNDWEKGILENHYEETVDKSNDGGRRENNTSRFLDDVLDKIQEESKKKIWKQKAQLMSDDFEFMGNLKQSVIDLTAKEDELRREVEKKVSKINSVTSTIFSGPVDSGELNKLIAEILQLASDFKTESSEKCQINVDSNEFTDMISKEIEVFRTTPTIVLQRKWNTSNELLQLCSSEKLSHNPILLQFLLQSEEKNSLVNVLEKYLWSLYKNLQFH